MFCPALKPASCRLTLVRLLYVRDVLVSKSYIKYITNHFTSYERMMEIAWNPIARLRKSLIFAANPGVPSNLPDQIGRAARLRSLGMEAASEKWAIRKRESLSAAVELHFHFFVAFRCMSHNTHVSDQRVHNMFCLVYQRKSVIRLLHLWSSLILALWSASFLMVPSSFQSRMIRTAGRLHELVRSSYTLCFRFFTWLV